MNGRVSFVDREFCGKVSLSSLQINLSNVRFIPKDHFTEWDKFLSYQECASFLHEGNKLPEDSRCLFVSHQWNHQKHQKEKMSTLQYEIVKKFVDVWGVNFVWVDHSCIPAKENDDYEAMVDNIQTALLISCYALIIPKIIAAEQCTPFSDLEELTTRGWCNFEALGAMLGMSKTFLALKYGDTTTFHELMPWIREEDELSYDNLKINLQRLKLGCRNAYAKAGKVAISKASVEGSQSSEIALESPIEEGLVVEENYESSTNPEGASVFDRHVVQNWRRAGDAREPLDLLPVVLELLDRDVSKAMALAVGTHTGVAAKLANALGNFTEECDRLKVTNLLLNLAAFCLGKYWRFRRKIISDTGIGTTGIQSIADLISTTDTLHELDVSYNELGKLGTLCIGESLGKNDSLFSISMCNTGMQNDGAKAFAKGLEINRCLRYMNIRKNNIGDSGMQALQEVLRTHPTVQHVRFEKSIRLASFSSQKSSSSSRSRKHLHQYLRKNSEDYNNAWMESHSMRSVSSRSRLRSNASSRDSSIAATSRSRLSSLDLHEDDWKAHVGCLDAYYSQEGTNCIIQ
mmetsp:Transcript_5153/g.6543  ORF Transcript_5153/g.6543 Transcript_5153/m.6543 type:complete len:574 (-) Transcript_5153:129-1850(-)